MEFNAFLQKCNDDDVLELHDQMVKLSTLRSNSSRVSSYNHNKNALLGIAQYITSPSLPDGLVSQLFTDRGITANILRIGSEGWKKGKVKINITLEFCPDEPEVEQMTQSNNLENNQPESPLDDIRRMMNKDN